jgi:DNA-binding transcriptional LysR family regulator
LYKEESLLYCSVEHPFFNKNMQPINDDSLAECDAVVPSYPQSVDIKQQQKKLRATATSTDREGIAFLILTGQFIGFLPTHFAKRWVEKRKIQAINVETRKFNTNFSAITSKGARSHLILDAYLEELAKT